jgi:hypothetical protein
MMVQNYIDVDINVLPVGTGVLTTSIENQSVLGVIGVYMK